MTKQHWVISDLHLGHSNVLAFTRSDGSKLRDFQSIEEHDETIVDNWNKVVREHDRVYLLGDAVMPAASIPTLGRLNGSIVLVMGNHDHRHKNKKYEPFIKQFRGSSQWYAGPGRNWIMTHIPVHPMCLSERFRGNIHGHTHSNHLTQRWMDENEESYESKDRRYVNVSAEEVGYTPVSVEEITRC